MLLNSVCVLAPFLAVSVDALRNTSPLVVIAEQRPFEIPKGHRSTDLDTMQSAFEEVVTPAARSCDYNAYVFVKQTNVGEREVNGETMPFLSHAIDKAASRYLMAAALNGDSDILDTYVDGVERGIERQCNAKSIVADPHNTTPFEAYQDTTPRVITLDIPAGTNTTEADKIIKRVVGTLPSRNLFLAYRTTPSGVDYDPWVETEPEPEGEKEYESVFQNYSFFTPALFMGLMVGGLLLTVFIIGLTAVIGLQITPDAFEQKESRKKQ